MADWGDMLNGVDPLRRYDNDEVKQNLPLEWVLARRNIVLEPSADGRLVGLCPFHDDGESPSFALFTPPEHPEQVLGRAGCWSCSFGQGDVFDVLGKLHQVPYPQALQMAGALLEEFRRDQSWVSRAGEQPAQRVKADPADLSRTAYEANQLALQDSTAIARLIDEKQKSNPGWAHVSVEFLRSEWWVGVEDDWHVVVPHYSDVGDGLGPQCRAIKTRTPRSHLFARSGSDLSHMYGVWRLRGHDTILVVEGESDAWCASAQLGDTMDVLGIPSGASTRLRDEWKPLFAGKRVIVATDGDLAGRRAAQRWHAQLMEVAGTVLVATLPDGKDLSAVNDLARTVMEAGSVPPSVGNVDVLNGVFARFGGDVPTTLTNWYFEPTRELAFDDGSRAWEGIVNGRSTILRSQDMESEASITKWAGRHGGNWLGSKKDAQSLQGRLQSEGPFLGRGKATSVVGWHDGHFVLPDGYIGHDYWRYVPPAASVKLDRLKIQDGPWDPAVMDRLLRLRKPEVMHPVLAWVFAAPLRSQFEVFPFLAVTGQSGSGKTTLVRALLDALGWKIYTTITSTTPHGVQSFAGATNGLPVWFDEYRPGARDDSKQALDQVLRDAYDGSPSWKGGGQENKLALTEMPTLAPLVVTGEDAFSETSHIERMVWVKLARGEGSQDDLEALVHTDTAGFGKHYLSWLVKRHAEGSLPSLRVRTTIDRRTTNLQILGVGWELFRAFYQDVTGNWLGEADFSQHVTNMTKASSTDPTTEALVWAQGKTVYGGIEPLVTIAGDNVVVQLEDFVAEVKRAKIHTLPGGVGAIGEILKDNWDGFSRSHPVTQQRVWVLPGMAGRLMEATAPSAD